MKLLFDHNLSHRLVRRLADLFPDSQQTRLLGFERTEDRKLWEFAKTEGFTVVTLDKDFSDLASLWELNGFRGRKSLAQELQRH